MSFLKPNRNVWRIEKAQRAAVLIDEAAFFAAVRAACLKAQRSILVIGWDIGRRSPLAPEGSSVDDGHSNEFARFLEELVSEKPGLEVHLLLWDPSLLYAGEREPVPRLSPAWTPPERVTLCVDDTVPLGSSQHQKILVIDDAVAFCGGLDFTVRRWDTGPPREPAQPLHDVQMMVDGAAAGALALLARERWCRANGGRPKLEPLGDPWPDCVRPDFTDVEVGIARTEPCYDEEEEAIGEAETLFLDAVGAAERELYIETQFLTSIPVADRLARRLAERPDLQVVIVAPCSYGSWLERHSVRNGRIRFWQVVRAAGGGRVRLVCPAVERGGTAADTLVHSKVMVVDDRFLRVGSANLSNRSMGADTECDLAIAAGDDGQRAAIRSVRDRLLGGHCGVAASEVAAARARGLSLVEIVDGLSGGGHRLRPVDDGDPDEGTLPGLVERIADPAHPIRPERFMRRLAGRLRPWLILAGALLALIGVAMAWRYTALSDVLTADSFRAVLRTVRGEPWAIAVVCGLFVLAGILVFPLNVLILTTAAVFGPWLGIVYAAAGALTSGTVLYWIGRKLGRSTLERVAGPRVRRVLEGVRRRGLLTVVTFRLLPIAPFTLVNLAAGAGGIRYVDFALGTAIGLLPGLVLLSVMGDRIVRILSEPTAGDIGILLLCVAGLLGLAVGAQALLSRRGKRA